MGQREREREREREKVISNSQDTIIKHTVEKHAYCLDVAIIAVSSVTEKEAEKKLKKNNLRVDVQRMWNMKCVTIPAKTGATRIVTKV
jgi:hypothetical protein